MDLVLEGAGTVLLLAGVDGNGDSGYDITLMQG